MFSPPIRPPEIQRLMQKRLPELITLEKLLANFDARARIVVEETATYEGVEFPLYSITIGSEDKTAPCLGVMGGVHGLERIGSSVVIAYLQSLNEIMSWDETFVARLQNSRLVFMPIVNPVGMYLTRRANGKGVDLMRNSPVQADEDPAWLLGGQTYSSVLPWFRGETHAEEAMEVESRALCRFVAREMFPSRLSLAVDVHSGFGSVDRLWFPYARSKKAPPNIVEITALKRVFDRSYPNHFYRIEPQSKSYTTHGDLWDWLYDRKPIEAPGGLFLPWTLELGSWIWLKKNPRQLFSSLGAFNPLQPHRLQRILRRHLTLFDFFHRALLSPQPWTDLDEEQRRQLLRRATEQWFNQN
jgi:Zinc carboxypeptidase